MKRILGILITCLLTACATTVQLTPTDRVPAAEGEMKLGKDGNDNTEMEIKLQFLAPPDKLRGDLTTYVVWVRDAASETWTNVGQLQVDDDRSGAGTFSVPYQKFDVQVSAVADPQAATPGEFVVFEGQVDR